MGFPWFDDRCGGRCASDCVDDRCSVIVCLGFPYFWRFWSIRGVFLPRLLRGMTFSSFGVCEWFGGGGGHLGDLLD